MNSKLIHMASVKRAGYAFLLFFFCALGTQAQVQTQILCGENDSFCIALDSIGGSVQWESSTNGSAYADLSGETSDTLCISGARDSVWYRARFDLEGCPSLYSDTIKVTHFEVIANAGPDVTYCNGSDAQLGNNPVAGVSYSWMPMDALDDASIANPTTNAGDTIDYILTASDANGCMDMDTVRVNVIPTLADSSSFMYSGADTCFVFPQCIDTVTLKLWGAQGFGGVASPGGEGGYAEGTLVKDMAIGDTIFLWVGGQDGFNGGGLGGMSAGLAGGNGGGATDARYGSNDVADRMLVAGGGGGSGGDGTGNFAAFSGGEGGDGGTTFGANGTSYGTGGMASLGLGGTQVNAGPVTIGGAAGCVNGGNSSAGVANVGGAGGNGGGGAAGCTAQGAGGGGGGGGFFGGSGGGGGEGYQSTAGQTAGGGGGGGGSSYIGGVTNGVMARGGNTGNGRIRIVW